MTGTAGKLVAPKTTIEARLSVRLLPSVVDLDLERDTTNLLEFVLTDAEGKAIDIALDDVKFTAKESPGGTVTIATKTSSAGSHADGPNGRVEFLIAKTDIDDEAQRAQKTFWVYEVRRVQPGGEENVHAKGGLVIHPDVGTDA